jgi:hypothetical protein
MRAFCLRSALTYPILLSFALQDGSPFLSRIAGEDKVGIIFHWTALAIPETLCVILSNQERSP